MNGRSALTDCGPASFAPGVGVGFKASHADAIRAEPGTVQWFEVHPENYMVAGGPRLRQLEELRTSFPLSLHGVGLSLGGVEPPDRDHLKALRDLVRRFEPALVSEHIAWSSHDGIYLADLLPVGLSEDALKRLVRSIDITQNALGRQILIENPARYLRLPGDEMDEAEFLAQAAQQSGCGLLVDVNNVYVGAHNLGFDGAALLDALPAHLIGEIHLAGHAPDSADASLLIDNHGAPVADAVWRLYARLIGRIGRRPTLIEWDTDVPAWPVLRAEAERAENAMVEAAPLGEPAREPASGIAPAWPSAAPAAAAPPHAAHRPQRQGRAS
jgi:uncharacterized protein (UPF0276 family)